MPSIQRNETASAVTPSGRRQRRRHSFAERARGGLLQVVGRTVVVGLAVLSVMAAIGPSPVSAGTVTAAAPLGGPAAVAALPVSGGGSVTPQVVAGGSHTCALLSDGTVRCWGRGADGRLGDGFTVDRLNPVQVLASGTAETDPVVLDGVTQIAAGNAYTCALLSDGTVRCWGSNSAGQLGDGSTTSPVESGAGPRVRHRRDGSGRARWGDPDRHRQRPHVCAAVRWHGPLLGQRERRSARGRLYGQPVESGAGPRVRHRRDGSGRARWGDPDRRRQRPHVCAAVGWHGALLGRRQPRATR
jgi:hypothetical protein